MLLSLFFINKIFLSLFLVYTFIHIFACILISVVYIAKSVIYILIFVVYIF